MRVLRRSNDLNGIWKKMVIEYISGSNLAILINGSWKLWQCFVNWLGISWCMPRTVQWLMAGFKREL
jgi:hypothetical protein